VVYDSSRHRFLLYGGREYVSTDPPLNDVLELDLEGSSEWTPLETVGDTIPALIATTLIYDPVRDRLILFGGSDPFRHNDVWSLDLAGTPTWNHLVVNGTPPAARQLHVAIYDPVRDRLVIFGGSNSSKFNDVWAMSLSGTPTWTQLLPGGTPPSPRDQATAIYDPVRDRMVVFGGVAAFGGGMNETWVLSLADPVTWTKLTPASALPAPRASASSAYDPVRDEMVIHGGTAGGNETWRLSLADPPAWTEVQATPPGRYWHTAAYDAAHGVSLIFSGQDAHGGVFNDVWALSSGDTPSWSQLFPSGAPAARLEASAIYDPVGVRMLVFGGGGASGDFNEVWQLSLSGPPAWSFLSATGSLPEARDGQSAVYDSNRHRMIVFGGSGSTFLNDIWSLSLDGSPAWTQVIPAGTPPTARTRAAAVYDPVGDRMIVFGGMTAPPVSAHLNDTWELDFAGTPTWSPLTPLGSPPPVEEGLGSAFDSARNCMLVMGYGSGEVWELTMLPPMTWRRLDPGGSFPGARLYTTVDYDAGADRLVLFGGYFQGGAGDSWLLTFSPTVSVGPSVASSSLSLAPLGSNPVRGDLAVTYSLPTTARAFLDIFDVRGRRVLGIEAPGAIGAHRLVASPSGQLMEGVYWIRLTQGTASTAERVVVLR
jgi:galactose oxidase-like protein